MRTCAGVVYIGKDTIVINQTSGSRYLPITVSVIHKDSLVCAGVVATLNGESRFAVQVGRDPFTEHPVSTWQKALSGVDVVIADYSRALDIAQALRKAIECRQAPATKIMIISDRDGESQVRHALESGIRGYLPMGCKPEEIADGIMALHRGQRILGSSVAQRMAESFDHEALTARQTEVLRLVVAGYANKMVAKELGISLGTVKVHVKSILAKLGARTRTEASTLAQRRGLVMHEYQSETEAIGYSYASKTHERSSATWV